MNRLLVAFAIVLFAGSGAFAEETAEQGGNKEALDEAEQGDGIQSPKTLSGMSILGNEEAPKSLVIVPWKSSQLGDGLGISNALDQSPRAVDKEVFMRELHFHALRSVGSE